MPSPFPPSESYTPYATPSAPAAAGASAPGASEDYIPSMEELERLAELGLVDEQLVENIRRQKAAEEAASMSGPEGRQAGGIYTAASPLEHAASALQRIAALRRSSKLDAERTDLLGKKKKGLEEKYNVGFQGYGYPKPFQW